MLHLVSQNVSVLRRPIKYSGDLQEFSKLMFETSLWAKAPLLKLYLVIGGPCPQLPHPGALGCQSNRHVGSAVCRLPASGSMGFGL